MISILPSARTPFDVIGADVGQALQGILPQAVEKGFNRGMLQKSLEDIKNLSSQKNLTPLELLTSVMQAGAGIPGSERYIGQIYPLLLNQLRGQMAPSGPASGGTGLPQAAQSAAAGMQQQPQINQPNASANLPIPLPQPSFEPYKDTLEGIELGQGPIPKTYSPEQYQQVNQQYLSSSLDPEPALNAMKMQDDVSRAQLDDMIRGAETVGKIADLRAQQQERVRTKLREHLPELNEPDFAVAERIAQRPEFSGIKNDNLRAQKVKQEYNLYQSALENFKKNSERFNYNKPEYNRQLDQLGHYAEVLVRNGQRDLAEQLLKNNGWGPVETSTILNPLPQNVLKDFRNAPKIKSAFENVNVLPDDPRFEEQADKAIKMRENTIKNYKNLIEKDFKTGSYDPASNVIPGTSLLQLRDEAMKNGMEWQEFEKTINDLIAEGKIKLDSYQEQERGYLGQHPDRSFSIGEIIWRLNPIYQERK